MRDLVLILMILSVANVIALPDDGILIPQGPALGYRVTGLTMNPDQGEITITGCTTVRSPEGDYLPEVWLETVLSTECDTLSIDTLARSTEYEVVLAASQAQQLSCLSKVSHIEEDGGTELRLTWIDTSAPGLHGQLSFIDPRDPGWTVGEHICRRTALTSADGPRIIFWRPDRDPIQIEPRLESPSPRAPGFHSGPCLGNAFLPLGTLDSLPPFEGSMPGFGLASHYLATGHVLNDAETRWPAVVCLDESGAPCWKMVLDDIEDGRADYMGSIRYEGDFLWLVAGTIAPDREDWQSSIFLAVVDDHGEILEVLHTDPGFILESVAAFYEVVLVSVIDDRPVAGRSWPMRTVYAFDITDPPAVFQ